MQDPTFNRLDEHTRQRSEHEIVTTQIIATIFGASLFAYILLFA